MTLNQSIPTNAFISVINRKHASYINNKVKDENLSYGLYPILINIYHNNGIIQEQIAENFQLSESTVTRNLKKLEDKGFIKRTKKERKKIITITPLGKKTAEEVISYDEQWDEIIENILGKEKFTEFKSHLIKICDNL